MINQFSTEATAVVFDAITADPDDYEVLAELVKKAPARACAEIRTFTERKVSRQTTSDNLGSRMIRTALRDVRWEEIRRSFQRAA